eukprot:jgi/Tetstr1/458830/TSEL_045213.t1
MEVAATSPLGVVPWLELNRPEVLAELRKVQNLCTGRLAQSKSLAPLGVADDRYRTDVCQGNGDDTLPAMGFRLPTPTCDMDQHVGCGEAAHDSFESLHPNTGAMMPGPEWLILSYHIPGMSAFLPEVDHDDDMGRTRAAVRVCHDEGLVPGKHETARTMAAAKEMRPCNPEAHTGDDEYIFADVKAAVAEATAGKTDEQEMRRVERINRNGGAPTRRGRGNARRPGQRSANARRPAQRGANMCKEAWIVFIHKVSFLRLRKIAWSRLPRNCTDWSTKLMRFPIEFFPSTTKSTCFMVGSLAQTVRHFGFTDTAANKIASALDMPGSLPVASWQHAVASVLFVECRSKTVKHPGYSIRSVRESWHNDNEMRRGI